MPETALIESVNKLSAKELDDLLKRRKCEDAAIRVLWRAAYAREREERRQQRKAVTCQ